MSIDWKSLPQQEMINLLRRTGFYEHSRYHIGPYKLLIDHREVVEILTNVQEPTWYDFVRQLWNTQAWIRVQVHKARVMLIAEYAPQLREKALDKELEIAKAPKKHIPGALSIMEN